MATQQEKLKSLQQAFITADKDGDSLLNKEEFKEFVEIGYRKPCPNGMYSNLCSHFQRDTTIGIDWNTARTVWLQAQKQPSKSPSPQNPIKSKSPSPSQNGQTSMSSQSNIKQAFAQCDKDGDGLLNKLEFHEFVKVGFKKPSCPPGMYEQVCGLFKKDTSKGIDWLSAYSLWKKSNPAGNNNNTTQNGNPSYKKNKTPPPKQISKKPPNLKRIQTHAVIGNNKKYNHLTNNSITKPSPLSPSKSASRLFRRQQNHSKNVSYSGSGLTKEALRKLDHGYDGNNLGDDQVSIESDMSFRSGNARNRTRHKSGYSRSGSLEEQDASTMVVQMMETKLKNLQTSFKLERAKRKKTEELAQSLLQQNETYKTQISDIQQINNKTKIDSKSYKDQLRKLKTQLDDDRRTIKHLQQQRNAMKIERDETFTLLTKIEKEHQTMIKKEKKKHKDEIDKLSKGFLQSLGADNSGKDVLTVIKELVAENKELNKQKNTLAELLARKQQSLLEALQAVDNISISKEQESKKFWRLMKPISPSASSQSDTKFKRKVSSLKQKYNDKKQQYKQNKINNSNNKTSNDNDLDDSMDIKQLSTLPKPPKRRNSQIGLIDNKPHHRITATLFKRAVGDNSPSKKKINPNQVKSSNKEMQFLSEQLTEDVAIKQEQVQNLQVANNALVEQMQEMQQKMSKLQNESKKQQNNKNKDDEKQNNLKKPVNGSVSDLP